MQQTQKRPTALAIWLVIAALAGLTAAFELTIDKIASLEDPTSTPFCDVSVLVQCTANLESWQGEVFGFPNPLMGLVGWMAPLVVGVAILSGARFAKWFWALFTLGMTFAFGLVCWLIFQSIFVLGTLCIWCMLTWLVTIPSFYGVLLHSVRIGAIPLPQRVRKLADTLMGWLPLLATVSYVVIVILAQVRLDAIVNIFG
ncbi:vitamin K epoxide reductase family protein [Microbacterium indicum]|uniref:vitamin K epoxide reductase family protein n=1 Tax=Microbacterium indicum TaxID=358100 RepID=UPI00041BAA5D|nr:vitamin K epoxide reductase family protein [Microbacterium indicum]